MVGLVVIAHVAHEKRFFTEVRGPRALFFKGRETKGRETGETGETGGRVQFSRSGALELRGVG